MIRIVLADDQALVRQGIGALIELTHEVEVVAKAENGDEAFQKILEHRPAVALLDVRMPGMTGVEVLTALRESGDATPVVLLTTFDDEAVLLEGVRAGGSGFLLKDIDIVKLVDAPRTVVEGGTLILPAVTDRPQRYLAERPSEFEAAELPDRLTPRESEVLRLT